MRRELCPLCEYKMCKHKPIPTNCQDCIDLNRMAELALTSFPTYLNRRDCELHVGHLRTLINHLMSRWGSEGDKEILDAYVRDHIKDDYSSLQNLLNHKPDLEHYDPNDL